MAKEETSNNGTQDDRVAAQIERAGWYTQWYGTAGIGLVGGVVGALIVAFLAAQSGEEQPDVIMSQIEAQAVQIDAQTARIEAQAVQIERLNAEQEQGITRILDRLLDLDEASRQHGEAIEALNETSAQTRTMQADQATELQDLAQDLAQDLIAANSDIDAEIEGLKGLVAQILESQSQPTPQDNINIAEQPDWSGEITIIQTRLGVLEQQIAAQIAAMDQFTAQLTQRLDGQENRVANVMDRVTNVMDGQNAAIEGFIAEMRAAFEGQTQNLENLARDVATLSSAPPPAPPLANDQSMAMLIAANTLKTAVDRGGSYVRELQIFTPLAPAGFAPDMLEQYASVGLPNIAELSLRFAKLADEIAAIDNVLPQDASLTDQLLHQGSRLYSSRPVGDVEGDSAGAIAARMEMAISRGDFARALSEAQALPEEAKKLAADFIELLQAREAVDALLSRLIATALQQETLESTLE